MTGDPVGEFAGYYVKNTEVRLWTVGFDHPRTGRWYPDSDHDNRRDAKHRAWLLNGIEQQYAYLQWEPGVWTVGDCTGGEWCSASDHASAAEAAHEVIRLNM